MAETQKSARIPFACKHDGSRGCLNSAVCVSLSSSELSKSKPIRTCQISPHLERVETTKTQSGFPRPTGLAYLREHGRIGRRSVIAPNETLINTITPSMSTNYFQENEFFFAGLLTC